MASTSQRASRRRPSAGVDCREKKINLKERRGSPRDDNDANVRGGVDGRPPVVDHSPANNGPSASAGGGDVAPPSPARRGRLRSLPAGEQRRGISEGMRVKVRFVEEAEGPAKGKGSKGKGSKSKGGKGKKGREKAKEEKWFPGTIGQILNGGKKIRIHYDDGTEETAQFPDGDVCVEGLLGELVGEAGGADAGEEGSRSAKAGTNALAAGGGIEDGHVPSEGGGDIDGGNNEEAKAPCSNDDDGGSAAGSGAAEDVASDGKAKQSAPSAAAEENVVESDAGKAGGDEAAVAEAGGKERGPSASAPGEEPPVGPDAKPQSARHAEPSVQQREKPPHRLPFNQALKSALDAHHRSRTLVKSRNDPTPLPPPFLSRDEECAVRTALAFAVARARVRGREMAVVEEGGGGVFLSGGCGPSVLGGDRRNERPMRRARRTAGGPSSLLGGGLPSVPPRRSMGTAAGAGGGLARDRRLDHVRDVLRLAVSAALPMYRGALEGDDDEGAPPRRRRPCAVYDYEAAVLSAANGGGSGDRDRASLDGLCRHAAARLAGLRREEARRAKRRGRRGAGAPPATPRGGGEGADEDRSTADGSEKGREGRSDEVDRTSMGRSDDGETVRGAVARLVRDDLLGSGSSGADAAQQIERVLAVCHVLHRLLFVDATSCLGAAVVSAICAALGDLHSNRSRGRAATDDDASARGSIGGEDGESRAASRASGRSGEGRRDGEARPAVPARWHAGAGGYVHGRHERRRQAVDVLSRRSGAKRVHPHEEEDEEASSSSKKALPLPRIGDVLAANLLRLLEGAAAIRLHHRQRRVARDGGERGHELDQAASSAAAEVLAEIRAAFGGECQELLLPVRAEDAAAFYFHEKRASEGSEGRAAMLLPGGKLMLRRHLFGLTSKLALYEQA